MHIVHYLLHVHLSHQLACQQGLPPLVGLLVVAIELRVAAMVTLSVLVLHRFRHHSAAPLPLSPLDSLMHMILLDVMSMALGQLLMRTVRLAAQLHLESVN